MSSFIIPFNQPWPNSVDGFMKRNYSKWMTIFFLSNNSNAIDIYALFERYRQRERERECIICSDIMNARGYVCQILNINTIIWSKFGKWSSFYLYNFKKILLILRLIGLSSQSSVIRMGDFHLRFFFNSL